MNGENEVGIEEATIVRGRIAGVRVGARGRGRVAIRYEDGGSGRFVADGPLIEQAGAWIGRRVAAAVTYMRGSDASRRDGRLERLEELPPEASVLDAMRAMRGALDEHKIAIGRLRARLAVAEREADRRRPR